ncbi:MAG TPA: hypothetical protein VES03_01160 [Motilibacterales bacterium]|nr:hypothetical protein [Motilibacterales bacterium]
MRAYVPLGWAELAALDAAGRLDGPLRGCAVDPAWRAESPDVDEEQWEYEAQLAAAESLSDLDGGVVLAVDVPEPAGALEDGWVELPGPVSRRDTAAVLTADLAWFAVQEIPGLLSR